MGTDSNHSESRRTLRQSLAWIGSAVILIACNTEWACKWLSGRAAGDIAQFAGGMAAWIDSVPVFGNENVQGCLTVLSIIAIAVSGVMVWWPRTAMDAKPSIAEDIDVTTDQVEATHQAHAQPETPGNLPDPRQRVGDLLKDIERIDINKRDIVCEELLRASVNFNDMVNKASSKERMAQIIKMTAKATIPVMVEKLCGRDERKAFDKEILAAYKRRPKDESAVFYIANQYLLSIVCARLARIIADEKK